MAGNRQAFADRVREHQARIFQFIRHPFRGSNEVADLTQETFIRAYQALPRWRPEARFQTWLLQIARNAALDALRQRRRHADDPLEQHAEPVDPAPSPFRQLQSARQLVLLEQLLARLPHEQREILLLREVEGLPYDELAINVGVLAAVGWQKLSLSHDGLPMPSGAPTELSRELQLSASQLQRWHDAEAPFLAYLRTSNASLGEHRNRLIEAIFAEQVNRAVIDAEQAKIADLQNEQQRLLIDQLLQEREILEPQQRARLAQVLPQQSFGADSIEQLHRQ